MRFDSLVWCINLELARPATADAHTKIGHPTVYEGVDTKETSVCWPHC